MSSGVQEAVTDYLQRSDRDPEQIRILDWGCGRGQSVAKLREVGFQAYGVEIDRSTMENGFDLFRSRELVPEDLLKHVDDTQSFSDASFDVVFTEQVLEHVRDIDAVVGEMARLLKPGGISLQPIPWITNS